MQCSTFEHLFGSHTLFHLVIEKIKWLKFSDVTLRGIKPRTELPRQEQKHFSFESPVATIKDFHHPHKLGQGGFGPVLPLVLAFSLPRLRNRLCSLASLLPINQIVCRSLVLVLLRDHFHWCSGRHALRL